MNPPGWGPKGRWVQIQSPRLNRRRRVLGAGSHGPAGTDTCSSHRDPPAVTMAVGMSQPASTPVIGRDDELDALRAFLDAVEQGPTALLLSGEPGAALISGLAVALILVLCRADKPRTK